MSAPPLRLQFGFPKNCRTIALFLTVVGIYGVMAFLVRGRRQEAGIRLALGARPGQVAGLVVRQGLAVSLVGVALGLGLAVLGGRVLSNLVVGIGPVDGVVFLVVPAVLLVAAFLAYFPAARAMGRVDPGWSLREG